MRCSSSSSGPFNAVVRCGTMTFLRSPKPGLLLRGGLRRGLLECAARLVGHVDDGARELEIAGGAGVEAAARRHRADSLVRALEQPLQAHLQVRRPACLVAD